MKVLAFTIWIALLSKASALLCYNCNSTSLNPNVGCHEEGSVSPLFLTDCGEKQYCGVLKLTGEVQGMKIESYTRSCQSTPLSQCVDQLGMYGCFYTCETDGCNDISDLPSEKDIAPPDVGISATPQPDATQAETTAASETTEQPDTTQLESTASSETTEQPDTTQLETTEASETTEQPDTTELETTEASETKEQPDTTQLESTEASETTQQPVTTQQESTAASETTQQPDTTQQESTAASETTQQPDTTQQESTAEQPHTVAVPEASPETETTEKPASTTPGKTTPMRAEKETTPDPDATAMSVTTDAEEDRYYCYNCTSMNGDGECFDGGDLDPSLLVHCEQYQFCETQKNTFLVDGKKSVIITRGCAPVLPNKGCTGDEFIGWKQCIYYCMTDKCNTHNEFPGEDSSSEPETTAESASSTVIASEAATTDKLDTKTFTTVPPLSTERTDAAPKNTTRNVTDTPTTNPRVSPLLCYTCTYSSLDPDDGCYDSLAESYLTECPPNLPTCGVIKIMDSGVLMYERYCAEQAPDVCDEADGFLSCQHTCQSDGCNDINILPKEPIPPPIDPNTTSIADESSSPPSAETTITPKTTLSTVAQPEADSANATAAAQNVTTAEPKATTSGATAHHATTGKIVAVFVSFLLAMIAL